MHEVPTEHLLDIAQIGLSLYIHIPWCIKKCPYCDFNSHTLPLKSSLQSFDHQDDSQEILPSDTKLFERYTDALICDAKAQSHFVQGRTIDTIFIGGGTPSLLPIACYERLFEALYDCLPIAKTAEITLEANPATLEHAPFSEYLRLGINRLSIGVQSFDETALEVLGRIHSKEQAIDAIQQAHQAGFERINVDLMYGLPNQTAQMACADIETALQAGATHLSWYQLTIEPNTAFYRNPPDLPNEHTLTQIEEQGSQLLHQHGFANYEVSAWVGKADTPCRHNLNYWQFGDYLAIGAGAHGKVSVSAQTLNESAYPLLNIKHLPRKTIYRFAKSRLPKDYLNFVDYPKFVQIREIAENERSSEFMMNALRLKEGVSVHQFETATGVLVSAIDNELFPLQHQGLMVFDLETIAPTALGFRYVNYLVQAFL